MKLIFNREEDVIVTKLEINGNTQDFDYLTFINKLIAGEELDDTEYPTDITPQEKSEIDGMIQKINEVISSSNGEEINIGVPEINNLDEDTIKDEIPF